MGEMADLVLEGGMCEQCGHIFTDECGYPRLCDDCGGDCTEAVTTTKKKRRKKGQK